MALVGKNIRSLNQFTLLLETFPQAICQLAVIPVYSAIVSPSDVTFAFLLLIIVE